MCERTTGSVEGVVPTRCIASIISRARARARVRARVNINGSTKGGHLRDASPQ